MNLLIPIPHANTDFLGREEGGEMPVPFLMCINIFNFSSVFYRHLYKLVSANLHKVTDSAEVMFRLVGGKKLKLLLF